MLEPAYFLRPVVKTFAMIFLVLPIHLNVLGQQRALAGTPADGSFLEKAEENLKRIDSDPLQAGEPNPAGTLSAQDQTTRSARPIELEENPSMGSEVERPFAYGVSFLTDGSKNFRGGAKTGGAALRYLQDTNITLRSDGVLGWHGGTFSLNYQNHHGPDGTDWTGDAQVYSNIDDVSRSHLYDLWFEQVLYDGKLRFKTGKVDANSEFAFVENGAEFLNSSMGFSPTLFVFPTYPEPRMSFNVFTNPTEHFYANFGVFDTADAGVMPIAEIGGNWSLGGQKLPGRLGLGTWHHTGSSELFTGGRLTGSTGYYLVFDQALWREGQGPGYSEEGISMFFQYGYADRFVSELEHHFGAGILWVGPLPGRDKDSFGLGLTRVTFTDQVQAGFDFQYESALEFFYKVQINPWLNMGPDFQYIRNPGGTFSQGNALVGTLRLAMEF